MRIPITIDIDLDAVEDVIKNILYRLQKAKSLVSVVDEYLEDKAKDQVESDKAQAAFRKGALPASGRVQDLPHCKNKPCQDYEALDQGSSCLCPHCQNPDHCGKDPLEL